MGVTVTASVKQISESTSEGSVRTHRVKCDRPEAKGGCDAGPMGGELFLIGLGGCFMSNLLAAINARDAEVADVEVAISAELDGTPSRFTDIEMQITADYKDKEALEKLVVIAERGCIVANTVKDAVNLKMVVK